MATYYISPTGNNTTGNGTSGNPWLTVAKFDSSSTTGDTCILLAGTYTFQSMALARTYQGIAYGSVYMDNASASTAISIGGSNLATVINNIIFQNAKGGSGSQAGGSAILGTDSGTTGSTIFNNCTFKLMTIQTYNQYNGGLFGYTNGGGAGYQTITLNSCLIDDIYEMATGIGQYNSTSSLFAGDGGATSIKRFTLNNCTLRFKEPTYNLKYVFGNRSSTSSDYFVTVKNTIMYNVNGSTLTWIFNSSLATISNTYSCNYLMSSVPSGTGNITTDPLFVDATNGNFNLRPTSPCIDTGTLV